MKFMYSAPCFSGDCGFCASCCDAEDDSSESEVIRRAEDLSKFFGPKKIDKITMNYNSKLKKWCKERGFRNPTDIGWTKETIKITKKNGETVKYRLLQECHAAVCNDPHCEVMFVNASDFAHTAFYTGLPMYEREDTNKDKIHFCGPCMTRKPSPPEISKE